MVLRCSRMLLLFVPTPRCLQRYRRGDYYEPSPDMAKVNVVYLYSYYYFVGDDSKMPQFDFAHLEHCVFEAKVLCEPSQATACEWPHQWDISLQHVGR
jgi:hypothetical protein